ncbi:MAG: hypothetical protein GY820_39135 [Gammaproteobacteria bacterium]|nr:hypothetical protein [Gammaproteobacteria bacterium]
MKEYSVRVPFTGFVDVTVEAESEKEAEEKFWEMGIYEFSDKRVDHHEWEFHTIVCQGNVLYAEQNEIEVEEI